MNTLAFDIEKAKVAYIGEIKKKNEKCDGIIIYGAGKYGREVLKLLRENGMDAELYCVTNKDYNVATVDGVRVIDLEELKGLKKSYSIIVAVKSPVNKEVVNNLLTHNITNYVDIPYYADEMLDDSFFRSVLEITPKIGCSVHCKFCPQDLFLDKYCKKKSELEMSFETFKYCIDNTPENLMIDFSGFVEPFLAKDVIKMMRYANSIGRDMRLFTTLVGLNEEKFESIKDIPFKRVVLHLPDEKGYANIPLTDEYWELLKKVIDSSKPDGSPFVDMANCQCKPHARASSIVRKRVPVSWNLIDRAGNLTDEELRSSCMSKGKIYCRHANKLDHNVLLPNGDIVLCCMDFGMTHIIGNLLRERYDDIIEGMEMQKIYNSLDDDTCDSLCRKCTEAKSVVL